MRILVTGGAGFIGKHLVRWLIEHGHHVTVVDDLSTGDREGLHVEAQLVEMDVLERWELINRFRAVEIDRVYHLACPASPVAYQRDGARTLEIAFDGTANALLLAQKHGARVLIASTSEVYGDASVHPQPETYRGNVSTWGPRASYDEGKRAAEALAYSYPGEVRVARIFNSYGPGMSANDGRAVPNFIAQALRDEPLTVYGDGQQTRSLCYVSDMVRGLVALMESDVTGPVNLGNPEEVTILEIAHRIRSLAGSSQTLKFRPLPVDDPHRRCPDIARARTLLGWAPSVLLEEGLRLTIEHCRAR